MNLRLLQQSHRPRCSRLNLIPKIVPQAFKCVEYIEGNGEPGSIKKVTFGEESQFNYMKQKVEALDKENFVYIYSVIEGDALMNKLEKITYETKLEDYPDGGDPYARLLLKEEGIKAGKEKALRIFKAIEVHLLANSDAY
ncbi:hypothetical protein ERO13_A02G052201v2 [Gossypium hirsutum]|uniref:Bet v I/Major latex protein domain-containing protein n=2 Tax=Gossypium TaxID=3633 RepID=A0A5D3A213_GOSMU|nr:hypothetical protein ERO13_A02G052201v2 [Gossypium hirsutum]TYI38913.1 hypothetical protein ES332_A02G062500v1 [Gossypium tomentosum]TYJ45485.1 hypothetical protein E1A91_A02G059700v1 [Gossypium mustelinum]